MLIEREKKYAQAPEERHVRGSNKCLLLQKPFELRNKTFRSAGANHHVLVSANDMKPRWGRLI